MLDAKAVRIKPKAFAQIGNVEIPQEAFLAALTDRSSLLDADIGLWTEQFDVNARAPFFLMQHAVRAMRERGDAPFRISRARFDRAMYWSPAQLVTHHASNGCILSAGDLLGTGTISTPEPEGRGCLLERTWRGRDPIAMPDGTERRFLEDGDEVTLVGRAVAPGRPSLGFGRCTGVVLPA